MEPKGSRSPLKEKPLPLPGQSVHERIVDWAFGRLLAPLWIASVFLFLAINEWAAVRGHWPRRPWVYTALAVLSGLVCGVQFWRSREALARLQLGRDGERIVGEQLERLRGHGAQVFHDVPGEGFNLDHVLLCRRGIWVIETKARSKRGNPKVTFTHDSIRVGGFKPDRDPVSQVQANARWLAQLLEASTGKRFAVRGVVLFPGWWVEPMPPAWKQAGLPWVLSSKALRGFIESQPQALQESDVALAAFHLERYVRAEQRKEK